MLEKTLEVPGTARKSNQSVLKEINPEYSLEELLMKLKLQYFGLLMQRAISSGKDPYAGKNWGHEKGSAEDEMVGWHHWLNGHEFEQNSGREWRSGKPDMLQFMGSQRVGHDFATEKQEHIHRFQWLEWGNLWQSNGQQKLSTINYMLIVLCMYISTQKGGIQFQWHQKRQKIKKREK